MFSAFIPLRILSTQTPNKSFRKILFQEAKKGKNQTFWPKCPFFDQKADIKKACKLLPVL